MFKGCNRLSINCCQCQLCVCEQFWSFYKGFWNFYTKFVQFGEYLLGNRTALSRNLGFTSFICWMHRNSTQYIFFDVQFIYWLQKSNVLHCCNHGSVNIGPNAANACWICVYRSVCNHKLISAKLKFLSTPEKCEVQVRYMSGVSFPLPPLIHWEQHCWRNMKLVCTHIIYMRTESFTGVITHTHT